MGKLSITLRSKKSSWRAVVVMRLSEVIYQEINKSRLTDRFNKIPGERGKEAIFLIVFLLIMAS